MSLQITKENFEQEVMKSDVPVLLDFWAPWCGPCTTVGPIVEELAAEVSEKAKVGKVNVDEQGELAQIFRVMSIPTLAVLKNGEVTDLKVGVTSKDDLKKMLGV